MDETDNGSHDEPSDFEITSSSKRESKKKSPTTSRKEKVVVMNPADATTRSKKLPKGYVYEVDTGPIAPQQPSLPPKRERKRVSLSSEDEEEGTSSTPTAKSRKLTPPKPKGKGKSKAVKEEAEDPSLKKRAIMEQLKALQAQLKEVEEEVSVKKEVPKKASPANKKVPRKQKRASSSSVYDRFSSDEEPVKAKVRGRATPTKTVTTERATRIRKPTKQFDEDSNDSEPDVAVDRVNDPQEWRRILHRLKAHPKSYPFHVPVDPVALRCYDYYDIIKRPMDFQTIEANIDQHYNKAEEFVEDVRQVFRNAFLYNQPGSDICQYTEILSDIFEKAIAKWKVPTPKAPAAALLPPPPPVAVVAQPKGEPIIPRPPVEEPNTALKTDLRNTIEELEDGIKRMKEDIRKLKRERNLTTTPKPAPRPQKRVPTNEVVVSMTYDEKVALSKAINELPRKALGSVVQIIKNNIPSLTNTALDEIEVDIDALGDDVLRMLEKYVKTVKKKPARVVAKAKTPAVPVTPVPAGANIAQQSKMAISQTAKSIESVQKKLNQLKGVKNENEDGDVNVDDVDEKNKGDSSSSSSSDSSSESSDSSTDDNDEKKRAEIEGPVQLPEVGPTIPTGTPVNVESESKDSVLKISEKSSSEISEKDSGNSNEISQAVNFDLNDTVMAEPIEKPEPQILEGAVTKEVEIQNMDGWSQLAETSENSEEKTQSQKDETWEQYQAKDLQNKQRQKELKEQEEAQKREKVERELERKRLEDERIKEEKEKELKQKQAEEEAVQAQRRELEEKRAAERRAREAASANSLNMMDQSEMMSSFTTGFSGGSSGPGLQDLLKLKDELKKD
eukprot:TRINITY_DN1465_c0_g1_i2.p1 TRINITY_DN1465_c0_g1~~TRINITY_DN1465_c0_g1_i2.p1  ORF type:complete len:884 (-),score=330.26 TRINITY_DN1465_c0_g1_i2:123-2651(-)